MGSSARNLTKLGFRRDVRLFLTALVGFLVLLVVVLVVMLDSSVTRVELAQHERWQAIADSIQTRLGRAEPATLAAQLEEIRSRYQLASIAVGNVKAGAASGETTAVDRVSPAGTIRIEFDAAGLAATRRAGRLTIAISTAAAGLGLVLLFLYLPRIVDPIERMLDDATALGQRADGIDETRYLVETFRNTIETMKEQKVELEILHEQQRLRASDLEVLTGTLTRSLSSGFIALDPQGMVVDVNHAAREILGTDALESGVSIEGILPGSEFARVVTRAVGRGEALSRVEIAHEQKLIGLATVPLRSEEKSLGTMLLFTDMTDVRRLEERLRGQQSLADLGEMSAGIAHEFRNALSTILGYLRLARRDELPPTALGRVSAAEQEAASLSASVDALLRFARPMTLDPDIVDLSALLSEVIARFRERHPAILFVTVFDSGIAIAGDAAALRAAFENVVRNAVEAIGEDAGHVTVSIEAGDETRILISDDGAGMEPAEIPRLLLPFQSDRPGGVGLGLPLARKIAILHGGSLEVTSSPRLGTAVVLTLPAPRSGSTVTKSNNIDNLSRSPFPSDQA